MRLLPSALAIAVLGAAAFSGSAQASAYSASFEGCQAAISDRLGLASTPASYNVEKVKSKSRFRDISYSVSANDDSSPVQGVKASCRVKQNGEVLALELDNATLPAALANRP
jgi:hypothetical protein